MNGGPRIISIEPEQPAGDFAAGRSENNAASLAETGTQTGAGADVDASWLQESDDVQPASGRGDALILSLVGLALAGWTGFFVWANLPDLLAGGTPAQWIGWIVNWSSPALLCLVALLVFMRTSRREGARFANVARQLGEESRQLEDRLRSVNAELSMARDFMAAQSRDLESLGRIAADRLSGSASQLAELVSDNGKRVDSISTVAQNALENMEKLRGQLPVIANAAKDVTNNIGNAGRTAHVQLENLVAGFQRLNEFGIASERQVETIRGAVEAALAEMARQADQLGAISQHRFAALTQEGEAFRQRLDQDEIAALGAIRARAAALAEELATHRTIAQASENEALEALRGRLATLHSESTRISGEIAAGEAQALAGWTQRAANHASSLREALGALDSDHRQALESGSARFARFAAEAQSLVARLREELDGLEAEMAARRENSDHEAENRTQALLQRLAIIDTEIARRREAATALLNETANQMAVRLGELEQVVAHHQQGQIDRVREVDAQCARIGERVAAFTAMIEQAGVHGEDAGLAVDRALAMLNDRLVSSRETLAGTDRQVAELTDASVRLLELIQASSEHAQARIPEALGSAEAGLNGIEHRVMALAEKLAEAGQNGEALSDLVLRSRADVTAAMNDMARWQDELGERSQAQESRFAALRDQLSAVRGESAALTTAIEASLDGAIAQLSAAARQAGAEIGADAEAQIAALSDRLERDSKAALASVIETEATRLSAAIENTVARAAEKGRDSTRQLREQLAKVDELASNLESRVVRARERAQEQVDSDFARRVALITESLNSTAIDVAKVLSAEVADTAWAAYMRGDRGIFTRRAVSLLDSGEAKTVLQHYERNREFREHVNHYIHDFEGMLRQLLSTRDGNALGVTLLSSDMGKLYVALAQAIERLRS